MKNFEKEVKNLPINIRGNSNQDNRAFGLLVGKAFGFPVKKEIINASSTTPIAPIAFNHKKPIFEAASMKLSSPVGISNIGPGKFMCNHGKIADRIM